MTASDVVMNIRYGEYIKALAGLDRLSNDPSLSDEQRKAVAGLIDQVKQVANKAPGTPSQ